MTIHVRVGVKNQSQQEQALMPLEAESGVTGRTALGIDDRGFSRVPELPEGRDALQFPWERLAHNHDRALVGLHLNGKLRFFGE